MLEIFERRNLIRTAPNPGKKLDYVVTIHKTVSGSSPLFPAELVLRYVPDKLVVIPESLETYFQEVSEISFENFENAAVLLLDDFNNELVPRWICLHLEKKDTSQDHIQFHQATIEDHQPKWHNERLLERLAKY